MRGQDQAWGSSVVSSALVAALSQERRAVTIVVRGMSMWPTLRPGDHCRVVPVAEAGLRPGAIVVLVSPTDPPVLHRVVRRDGEWVTTQGDGRWHADAPAKVERVIGIVVEARRGGRTVRLHEDGQMGRVYLLVVRLLALARRVSVRCVGGRARRRCSAPASRPRRHPSVAGEGERGGHERRDG